MKLHVKAALLSAFVLPGLGQLYKGAKVKGGIIMAVVNLFLLVALFLVLQGMGEFLVTARFSGMAAAEKVIDDTQRWPGPGRPNSSRGLHRALDLRCRRCFDRQERRTPKPPLTVILVISFDKRRYFMQ